MAMNNFVVENYKTINKELIAKTQELKLQMSSIKYENTILKQELLDKNEKIVLLMNAQIEYSKLKNLTLQLIRKLSNEFQNDLNCLINQYDTNCPEFRSSLTNVKTRTEKTKRQSLVFVQTSIEESSEIFNEILIDTRNERTPLKQISNDQSHSIRSSSPKRHFVQFQRGYNKKCNDKNKSETIITNTSPNIMINTINNSVISEPCNNINSIDNNLDTIEGHFDNSLNGSILNNMNMDTIKEITENEINLNIANESTTNIDNNFMKIPMITSINESSINMSISNVISSTPCKENVKEKKTQKPEKKPKKNVEPTIISGISTRPKRQTSARDKCLKEPLLKTKLRSNCI